MFIFISEMSTMKFLFLLLLRNAFIVYLFKGNVRFHSNDGINSKTPPPPPLSSSTSPDAKNRPVSPRVEEFQKKMREKTPIGKLGSLHPIEKFV